MIECVTFRVLVKPKDVTAEDPAYAAARRMNLDLSLENTLKREQAAVDEGTVVGFGPTAFKDYGVDNPIVVGDTIIYAKHAGKAVKDGADSYVIINDEDVVAIIRGNE